MRKVGETPWYFRSFNTCQHRGRVLHFFPAARELTVTEVILSERSRCLSVTIAVECKTSHEHHIACCSLGQHILLMAGEGAEVFAALVDVEEGLLAESTVRITELTVEGEKE